MVKKVVLFTATGIFVAGFFLLSFLYLSRYFEFNDYKKEANLRIINFFSEYQKDSEKAIQKYKVNLIGSINQYKTLDFKFESIRDIGDGDPTIETIHSVTLKNKKMKQRFMVKQIIYGDLVSMDWVMIK